MNDESVLDLLFMQYEKNNKITEFLGQAMKPRAIGAGNET